MTGNAPLYDPASVAFGPAERDPHGTAAHMPGAKLDAGDGAELRPFDQRAGAMDAFALPSVIQGRRVWRGEG